MAVTLTALQGNPVKGLRKKHWAVLRPIFCPSGVKVPFCQTPGTSVRVVLEPLSVLALTSFLSRNVMLAPADVIVVVQSATST